MAELAFDLGPEFNIIYHTGTDTAAGMAQGMDDLRVAGADVITEDISWFERAGVSGWPDRPGHRQRVSQP